MWAVCAAADCTKDAPQILGDVLSERMKLAACARQFNGRSSAPELGTCWLKDKLWHGITRQWLNILLSEKETLGKQLH